LVRKGTIAKIVKKCYKLPTERRLPQGTHYKFYQDTGQHRFRVRGRGMSGRNVRVSRGYLVICNDCFAHLSLAKLIDTNGISISDEIIHEICPNCSDYNRPLIDDLLGSSE